MLLPGSPSPLYSSASQAGNDATHSDLPTSLQSEVSPETHFLGDSKFYQADYLS